MTTPNDGLQNGQPEANSFSADASQPAGGGADRAGSELSRRLVDATFANLIAENYPEGFPHAPMPPSPTPAPAASNVKKYGPRDWPASDEVIALEEAETHFQPPTPTGVMSAVDPVRRAAAIMAVSAPVLAIFALVFHGILGTAATWIAAIAAIDFVVSLALLVWRMPAKPKDRYDDGAVV